MESSGPNFESSEHANVNLSVYIFIVRRFVTRCVYIGDTHSPAYFIYFGFAVSRQSQVSRPGRLGSRLAVDGSASKKETGGNVGERERFHVPPVLEGKRRAGHSSILASRADGLSLPLPLWPSFSSSSSPLLAKSLYLFRLARSTSSSQLASSFSFSLSLLHLDTTTSINSDNADTFDRYRQSPCWPISGPHYQSARGRQTELVARHGDGQG